MRTPKSTSDSKTLQKMVSEAHGQKSDLERRQQHKRSDQHRPRGDEVLKAIQVCVIVWLLWYFRTREVEKV